MTQVFQHYIFKGAEQADQFTIDGRVVSKESFTERLETARQMNKSRLLESDETKTFQKTTWTVYESEADKIEAERLSEFDGPAIDFEELRSSKVDHSTLPPKPDDSDFECVGCGA